MRLDADNAVVRAGHPEVGYISGAARQYLFVRGLDVRVRANDDRDPAVEITAQRALLRSRLGVMVDDDDGRARLPISEISRSAVLNGQSVGGIKTRP